MHGGIGSTISDAIIAITATANGTGTWQYSIDGGNTWSVVGAVSDTSTLLLRSSDSIRFVPDGNNGTTASLTYRAWDQTSGSAGSKVDSSTNGGTIDHAFSTQTLTTLTEDQYGQLASDRPSVTCRALRSTTRRC